VSVALNASGTVVMSGKCSVEDAETLLQLLQQFPSASLDWTDCTELHTAVLQVILAGRPVVMGTCGDPFIAEWLS